jgi:hypothetical protein
MILTMVSHYIYVAVQPTPAFVESHAGDCDARALRYQDEVQSSRAMMSATFCPLFCAVLRARHAADFDHHSLLPRSRHPR